MYLFYVDESGSANPQDTKHRYFVLVAVGVLAQRWQRIDSEIEQIKRLVFARKQGCDNLPELKSVWLRSPPSQAKHYLEPFGLTSSDLSQGVDALYGIMGSSDMLYAGVVVDTLALAEQMSMYPKVPPFSSQQVHQMAYYLLADRLNDFLVSCGPEKHGLLVHDAVESSQVAATGFQSRLKRSHQSVNSISEDAFSLRYVHHLPEGNVKAREGQLPRLIGEMHFEDSVNSNLLQVADLAAYNVLRQFQRYGDQWEGFDDFSLVERYPYFDLLLPRFVTAPSGEIKEGIILAPASKTQMSRLTTSIEHNEYQDEYREPEFDDEYAYFDDGDWSSMNGRV